MRGRDSQGNWRTPFDPQGFVQGGDFTEGTSWQYSWYVPHDVPGLIKLFGGKEAFCEKLDKLFVLESPENGDSEVDDIFGRIGEYWTATSPATISSICIAMRASRGRLSSFFARLSARSTATSLSR
jgi:hypothetical protein